MKKCLCLGRLPQLGRNTASLHPPVVSANSVLSTCVCRGAPSWRPSSGRRQWSRQFSASSPASLDRLSLRRYFRGKLGNLPVVGTGRKNPNAWIPYLERHLPPALQNNPGDIPTEPGTDAFGEKHTPGYELATLLSQARDVANINLLSHLGFRLNRWPAVHALLSQLVDAAEALQKESTPTRPPSSIDWGLEAGVSLDELTGKNSASYTVKVDKDPGSICFDELTERPFAGDLAVQFMAEVWQSLGSIVLRAADMPPNESKLAMSYVYQILARLHHSGAISDKVYQYTPPGSFGTPFRPPGMHLLSTHIMSVLSDAAWLVHEAEVAAKAAAAGEKSPFVPVKMGVRDLGPEIWLELILWCCIEHGHVREGLWLLEQMKTRTGDQAWGFKSWKPLLENPEQLLKTSIDSEDFWRHSDLEAPQRSKKHGSHNIFHGLGKRSISVEVATSLRDSLVNLVYLGLGFRGFSPTMLLQHVSRLDSIITPKSETNEKLQNTTKASNAFTVRVIESGGLAPDKDPRAFEQLLRFHPHVVPPWDADLPFVQEDLEQMPPTQLYQETSALSGLIEYNIRSYSSSQQFGPAFNTFSWLQEVSDLGKVQRINHFFERMGKSDANASSLSHTPNSEFNKPFESSLPQLSNITFAQLLDLATRARAYTFGEWLLFSNDVDGPPIHPSLYGDQALAPSILRFATATRNTFLSNQVIGSLEPPLSLNILRAIMNFRIVKGDWDQVIMMLNYVGTYRLKAWSHSNVTTLAGAILRLDQALSRETDPTNKTKIKKSLGQAKDILTRLLNGEFAELSSAQSGSKFQQQAIFTFSRIFVTHPGPLLNLTKSQQAKAAYNPATSHTAIRYIPTPAFDTLLSAVVDVQGSAAGRNLWRRWCLDPRLPGYTRLREGGVSRLYIRKERNKKRGDPHFDASWSKEVSSKAVLPDLSSVRIISQGAIKEQNQLLEADKSNNKTSSHLEPAGTSSSPSQGDSSSPEKVLDFCVEYLKALRLSDEEIDLETGGHLSRMMERGAINKKLWRKGHFVTNKK